MSLILHSVIFLKMTVFLTAFVLTVSNVKFSTTRYVSIIFYTERKIPEQAPR